MHLTPYITILIFSIIILVIDFYSFKGLKKIKLNLNSTSKRIINYFSGLFQDGDGLQSIYATNNGEEFTEKGSKFLM